MSIYYVGCPETIPDPACSDCPVKELGDVRSLFLVKNDFSFTNISSTAEWTTGLNAKDIYVLPWTRGGLTVTPNETPGFGDTDIDIDGFNFELNVFEPNYAGNCAFWNEIKRSKNFKVGYRTETQVHESDGTAQFIPMAPIAEDKKASVLWNIVVKFSQEDIPCPSTTPTGVFDRCIGIN